MSTSVVYLDKVFLGNLLVNGFILWASGRLGQVKVKMPRIMIGAGIGGAYSLLVFLPDWEYLFTLFAKLVVSVIMLSIAFVPLPPRRFIRCACFFYLISFVCGGAVIGFSQLVSQNRGVNDGNTFIASVNQYLWPGLIFSMLVIWGVVELLPRYLKGKNRLESMKLHITIFVWGKGVSLRALVDTGSSLCDPISGDPVVVVEHSAIKEILPQTMKDKDCCDDAVKLVEMMAETSWSERLRLIPFQAIGTNRGFLLGIRPDKVEFSIDNKKVEVKKVVVCIHGMNLDAGREYSAIINPAVLDYGNTA